MGTKIERQEKLNLLKQMAMANGVLTDNEKLIFRQIIPMTDEEAEEPLILRSCSLCPFPR